ncbi:MAG TPA: hypothetical protein VFX25_31400, partial [Streptosporangiaceae bacterium]|nr:hypothetical protein [Streptosporangiaceae bacterium]
VIGLIAAAALGAGAYAFAGPAAAIVALTGAGVAALAGLRALTPPDEVAPPPAEALSGRGQTTTFARFWRRHSDVQAATKSLAAYDYELRTTLQHLLAARLSERHGISLYDEPEAARRLLARGGSDRLWFWVDPGREAVTDEGKAAGIPPRTLAAIIERLERL